MDVVANTTKQHKLYYVIRNRTFEFPTVSAERLSAQSSLATTPAKPTPHNLALKLIENPGPNKRFLGYPVLHLMFGDGLTLNLKNDVGLESLSQYAPQTLWHKLDRSGFRL